VHPYPAAVFAHFHAHFEDRHRVANGTQGHVFGERNRAVEAHSKAPFGVGSDKERKSRSFLEAVHEVDLSTGTALHEDQPTDFFIPNELFDGGDMVGFLVAVGGNHKKLPDLFIERHAVKGQSGPIPHDLLRFGSRLATKQQSRVLLQLRICRPRSRQQGQSHQNSQRGEESPSIFPFPNHVTQT
jgi:hypothetical protein